MSYARGTIAALVDAVVPETPDAEDGQAPGALAIDLDETVATAFDELQEAPEGPIRSLGYETMPFAPVLALLLDIGALELILRRRRQEPLQSPKDAYARGPFSRLGPEDRMRAIGLLESDGLFPAMDERFENAPVGIVAYLLQGALFITMLAAYSDLGDEGESPQGWAQTDYPGPADGYAVHMGYEVERFEENDYTPADGSDDAGPDDDGATPVAADGAGDRPDDPDELGAADGPDTADGAGDRDTPDADAWFDDQLGATDDGGEAR